LSLAGGDREANLPFCDDIDMRSCIPTCKQHFSLRKSRLAKTGGDGEKIVGRESLKQARALEKLDNARRSDVGRQGCPPRRIDWRAATKRAAPQPSLALASARKRDLQFYLSKRPGAAFLHWSSLGAMTKVANRKSRAASLGAQRTHPRTAFMNEQVSQDGDKCMGDASSPLRDDRGDRERLVR
jgi:hypothetical protein